MCVCVCVCVCVSGAGLCAYECGGFVVVFITMAKSHCSLLACSKTCVFCKSRALSVLE